MPAGLGLLCPERGAEAVDLPERRRRGLHVELSRLGEEGALAEVVGLEERARVLADGAREDGRVDADEAPVVEEVVDGLLDLVAHAQAGALLRRAEPQVPEVQEEVHPVVFGLDGIVLAGTYQAQGPHLHLVSAGRPGLRADLAGERDAGLLRETAVQLPHLLRSLLLHDHALHHARTVAQIQEGHLSVHTSALHPTQHRYFPAHVLPQPRDLDDLAHGSPAPRPDVLQERGPSRGAEGRPRPEGVSNQPTPKRRRRSA